MRRYPTLRWSESRPEVLDQTLLPHDVAYVRCEHLDTMAEAIRTLRVRGAPAIGLAAGLGLALVAEKTEATSIASLRAELDHSAGILAGTRPTAVNLFWALQRMRQLWAREWRDVGGLRHAVLTEALAMIEEDQQACRAMGAHGAALLPDPCRVLTHCNAGYLATADYGTALAVVYVAHEQGKRVSVWADETRPLLQGARLTAWELRDAGIPVTLICDNMAATVMSRGEVDVVITGADRIAANGDAANKIGTMGVAILATYFGIPFYVVAPRSTIDLAAATGNSIPIEERDPREVTHIRGVHIAPSDVTVFNPAFDVTPAGLITAIITEEGVHRPPYVESLRVRLTER
ncbi:MAG: S-methyl-5-thioribose-1-phosphate isomerase [Candidatus Eisenbacteria bacterium]|nr:S-methyl-5-thioribose-1-phosphate isomerase [Candidatus Eisenbacteria bacterium]